MTVPTTRVTRPPSPNLPRFARRPNNRDHLRPQRMINGGSRLRRVVGPRGLAPTRRVPPARRACRRRSLDVGAGVPVGDGNDGELTRDATGSRHLRALRPSRAAAVEHLAALPRPRPRAAVGGAATARGQDPDLQAGRDRRIGGRGRARPPNRFWTTSDRPAHPCPLQSRPPDPEQATRRASGVTPTAAQPGPTRSARPYGPNVIRR